MECVNGKSFVKLKRIVWFVVEMLKNKQTHT